MLEEQTAKMSVEIIELKQRHIAEINSRESEIQAAQMQVNQLSAENEQLTIEVQSLKEQINILSKMKTEQTLEKAQREVIDLKAKLEQSERYAKEREFEIESINSILKSREEDYARKEAEYNEIIKSLRNTTEELEAKLRDSTLENKKMSMQIENEKRMIDAIENFKLPLIHKDRVEELTLRCKEIEGKYFAEVEETKKLKAEIYRLKSEINERVIEISKSQQEGLKNNFSVLISKLQQSISANKSITHEVESLKKELNFKNREVQQLHEEVEELMSKVRTLNVENNKLKINLNKYDPTLNLSILSQSDIETSKDEEIKVLRAKNDKLRHEIQDLTKNTVKSEEVNKLKQDFADAKKEIEDKNVIIQELLNQIKLLKETNALASSVTVSYQTHVEKPMEVEKQPQDTQEPVSVKQQDQTSLFVQKRFEFENIKRKLNEENKKLNDENVKQMKEIAELKVRLETVEAQNKNLEDRIKVLQRERDMKIEALTNRDSHLNQLSQEKSTLFHERNMLQDRINDLESEVQRHLSQVNFYKDYVNRLSQLNNDLLSEKETYLRALLNRQSEFSLMERKHKVELDKLTEECKNLVDELTRKNIDYNQHLKQSEEKVLRLKAKVESQSTIINSYAKKIEFQQKIIRELNEKIDQHIENANLNLDKNIQSLAEMNSVLFKSKLTEEDYKSFEAIKELQAQQKSQYEETIKSLEETIELITEKYFGLEEKYIQEKKEYEEEISRLKADALNTVSQYEEKIKDYERQLKEWEEYEGEEEEGAGEETGMDLEGKGQGQGENAGETAITPEGATLQKSIETYKKELEGLRTELNSERERRLKAESDLNKERISYQKALEEKLTITKRKDEIENEKAFLAKTFAVRESSWNMQKLNYERQIESFREEDKRKSQQLNELMAQLEARASERAEGAGEGLDIEQEGIQRDLEIENLRNEVLNLKKLIEEKDTEIKMLKSIEEGEGEVFRAIDIESDKIKEKDLQINSLNSKMNSLQAEKETFRQMLDSIEKERDELKNTIDELHLKISMLGDINVEEQRQDEGDEVGLTEQDANEIKKALDSGLFINLLERAKNLMVALNEAKKDTAQ